MIVSLFRRKAGNSNAAIVDAVYEGIISAARQPVLYTNFGIPDTPLGRYESLSAHMIVFLHRTRGASTALEALAQDVLDEFFKDVDHSIRELGIGDAGVPKRMKKLGRMFYGRMGPYWEALDGGPLAGFEEALKRNITPDDATNTLNCAGLAQYLLTLRDRLAEIDDAQFLDGSAGPRLAEEANG